MILLNKWVKQQFAILTYFKI